MNLDTLRSLIKTLEQEGVVDDPSKAFEVGHIRDERLTDAFWTACSSDLISITVGLLSEELSMLDVRVLIWSTGGESVRGYREDAKEIFDRMNKEEAPKRLERLVKALKEQIEIAQRFLANS